MSRPQSLLGKQPPYYHRWSPAVMRNSIADVHFCTWPTPPPVSCVEGVTTSSSSYDPASQSFSILQLHYQMDKQLLGTHQVNYHAKSALHQPREVASNAEVASHLLAVQLLHELRELVTAVQQLKEQLQCDGRCGTPSEVQKESGCYPFHATAKGHRHQRQAHPKNTHRSASTDVQYNHSSMSAMTRKDTAGGPLAQRWRATADEAVYICVKSVQSNFIDSLYAKVNRMREMLVQTVKWDSTSLEEHMKDLRRFLDMEAHLWCCVVLSTHSSMESAGNIYLLYRIFVSASAVGVEVDIIDVVDRLKSMTKEELTPSKASARGVQKSKKGAMALPASEPPGELCSCLPWLLHRAERQGQRRPDLVEVERNLRRWAAANRWLTAATDCICASSSSALLRSPVFARSTSLHRRIVRPSSPAAVVEARSPLRGRSIDTHRDAMALPAPAIFSSFSAVLQQDNHDFASSSVHLLPDSGDRSIGAHSDCRTQGANDYQTSSSQWFSAWCADTGADRDSCASSASLSSVFQPYWRLVLREMLSSGIEATELLCKSSVVDSRRTNSGAHGGLRSGKAHRPLPRCSASSGSPSAEAIKVVQFHAVGVFLSLRRIASSMQRHRRLEPILALYAFATGCGDPETPCRADAGSEVSREGGSVEQGRSTPVAMLRTRILNGDLLSISMTSMQSAAVLLWREVVLFDIAVLLTLGHTSEQASDLYCMPSGMCLTQLEKLQEACLQHLQTLGAAPLSPSSTAASTNRAAPQSPMPSSSAAQLHKALTPRTRTALIEKLHEALRLSAKVLLQLGEVPRICALYHACPDMGTSWEMGRALLQGGEYAAALKVLAALMSNTKAAKASRSAVVQFSLEAVHGAAKAIALGARDGDVASRKCDAVVGSMELLTPLAGCPRGGSASEDGFCGFVGMTISGQSHANSITSRTLALYEHLCGLSIPLALVLDALLRGVLSGIAAHPAGDSQESAALSLALATTLIAFHQRSHGSDGLLQSTVGMWADCIALSFGEGAAASHRWLPQELKVVIADVLHAYPHVPVARMLLTQMSRHRCSADALLFVLHLQCEALDGAASLRPICMPSLKGPQAPTSLFAFKTEKIGGGGQPTKEEAAAPRATVALTRGMTELHIQDTLRAIPLVSLEQLFELLSSSHFSSDVSRTNGAVAADGGGSGDGPHYFGYHHILDRLAEALQYRRIWEEEHHQPWQCCTCQTWNSRFAVNCKLCAALSTVLVQCRACGSCTSSAAVTYTWEEKNSCSHHGEEVVCQSASSSGTTLQRRQVLRCSACDCLLICFNTERLSETAPLPSMMTDGTCDSGHATKRAATVLGSGRPAHLFCRSSTVQAVLPLRQWSCSHCQHRNPARCTFYCSGCGRPSLAAGEAFGRVEDGVPERHQTSTKEAVGTAACDVPCMECQCVPRTLEELMQPWCERCGCLAQRLQRLSQGSSPGFEGSPPLSPRDSSGADATRWRGTDEEERPSCGADGAAERAQPSFWFCIECQMQLNPWVRTHCGLCGGGRPLNSAASPCLSVPWRQVKCPSCGQHNRLGAQQCSHCSSAPLPWPADVQEELRSAWWRWVGKAVVLKGSASSTARPCRVALPEAKGSTVALMKENVVADSMKSSEKCSMHTQREPYRWICLSRNCLHVNTTAETPEPPGLREGGSCSAAIAAAVDSRSGVPSSSASLGWRCGGCGQLCTRVKVLNPYSNVLGWRFCSSHTTCNDQRLNVDSSPSVAEISTAEGKMSSATPSPLLHATPSWTGDVWEGIDALLLSGSVVHSRPPFPAYTDSQLLPDHSSLRLSSSETPYLFICSHTGHCSFADGCGCAVSCSDSSALPFSSSVPSTKEAALLPGEMALALRVLLKRMVDHLCSIAQSIDGNSAAVGLEWTSTFAYSAVQLFMGATEELLPWRGCDLSRDGQPCAVDPRVAVLPTPEGAIHSAVAQVRQIIEFICSLCNHSLSSASSCPALLPTAKGKNPGAVQTSLHVLLSDPNRRRLLVAALDLINLMNTSTSCDDVGFATLQQLCLLFQPTEAAVIATEVKWIYLRDMKLSPQYIVGQSAICCRCLSYHESAEPCHLEEFVVSAAYQKR